jgi:hypothetical protein
MDEENESIVEQKIRQAIESGEFKSLPNAGKPLSLEDDEHVPSHLRMAHKLLRDNDLAPEWIMQRKEIDGVRPQLLKSLRRAAKIYRKAHRDLDHGTAKWQAAQATFRKAAETYNRRALSYNLKVPPGFKHQRLLQIEREIQRALDEAD